MKEARALHIMTLISRRSSAWAFDVVATTSINHGEVKDEAIRRFAKEITDALALIDNPDFNR